MSTTTQKMTIHRALSELKLIDAKIEKQTMEILPVAIYQKDKLIGGYMKPEDFSSQAQSRYDSVVDLIQRKVAIKAAIVATNAVTQVTVGTKKMTIADAITMKAVIAFKERLIFRMKQLYNTSTADLNKNNGIVEQNVQRLLEATFGKENVKVSKDDIDAIRKPYLDANTYLLFDPIQISKKVEEMEKEVSEFKTEIDAVLSEINAITMIEF